jgi:hypothetical protein
MPWNSTLCDWIRGESMSVSPEDELRERIRGEYLEMPGLRLTPGQMQRLGGVERSLCQMVLDALVDEKFLCVKSDGAYARVTDGAITRPRAARADSRRRQPFRAAS